MHDSVEQARERGQSMVSKLHPAVAELLNSMPTAPPQPWEVSLSYYRSAGEKLAALACDPNDGCGIKELDICLSGRTLRARTYRPEQAPSRSRGLVYFHGGGFVRGSIRTHDALCREICVQGEFTVISVEYRLAPEHTFPSAHNDAIDSFRWLSDHADSLGIDRQKLAIAGDSVGAMLAASAAMALNAPGDEYSVKAQGLLCPVLDPTMGSASVSLNSNAPLLSRDALAWAIEQYFPDRQSRESALVSPLFDGADLLGAPPALIVSAEVDPVADDARRYLHNLRSAGVRSHLHEYAGMPHSFFLLAGVLEAGRDAISVFSAGMADLMR